MSTTGGAGAGREAAGVERASTERGPGATPVSGRPPADAASAEAAASDGAPVDAAVVEPADPAYLRVVKRNALVALVIIGAFVAGAVWDPYPWPLLVLCLSSGYLALWVLREEMRVNSTWSARTRTITLVLCAVLIAAGPVAIVVDLLT